MSIPTGDSQPSVEDAKNLLPGYSARVQAVIASKRLDLNAPPPFLRYVAWVGVALWAATVWWFSSRTGPEIEEMNVFELSDKVAHFIAFFAGTPAVFCAFRWSFDWTLKKTALVCMLAVALYGAADEYHQTFTVNRTGADVWDWTGDALGGIMGTLVCAFAYVRLVRSPITHRAAPSGD